MNKESRSYTEGFKQTYYLNSIRTRTHTALFIKSLRKDNRGHLATGIYQDHALDYLGFDQQKPSSSLKLDEIILLTNNDFDKLRQQDAIRTPDDGGDPIPAFSTHTADNDSTLAVGSPGANDRELANGDSYRFVYDVYDVAADPRIDVFIKRRALKRVQFHYSYQLCPLSVNSFDEAQNPPPLNLPKPTDEVPTPTPVHLTQGRKGKLTLEAISTYGPNAEYSLTNTQNTAKLLPDFVFEYKGPNPAYDQNKWDGFGMYCTNAPLSRLPSTIPAIANQDGAAWSLTGIVTPLGGRTEIQYERDQYAHVSDNPAHQIITLYSATNSHTVECLNLDMTKYFQVGESVRVKGTAKVHCMFPDLTDDIQQIDQVVPITAVTEHSITLSTSLLINTFSSPGCTGGNNNGISGHPAGMTLKITKVMPKYGGDIRVAAVTTTNEIGAINTIKYNYDQPTSGPASSAVTSGVVSQEGDWIKDLGESPISTEYDYPNTPVIYSNVQVLRGPFRPGVADDWEVKEEYAFFTPSTSMISTPVAVSPPSGLLERRAYHKVVDLGKIGQLKSVRKLNRRGETEFATTMEYSSDLPNKLNLAQGKFTEGAMLHDYVDNAHYLINRTTKEYIPTVLKAITTTSGGLTTKLTNEGYDFYTGQVVTTSTATSTGEQWRTLQVPAYALTVPDANAATGSSPVYPTMGAKGDDPGNRHLLVQPAAAYTYQVLSGPGAPADVFTPDLRVLLSASVQTWNSSWNNYREWYSVSSSDYYKNVAASPNKPVWRQHESWVWNSPALNQDGTYAGFVPFDWASSTQASAWQKVVTSLRYDHYSSLLEARGINRQTSAQKNGYGDYLPLAQATNAQFNEIAYSGAEDLITGNGSLYRFGGEVMSKSPQTTLHAHTGAQSVAAAPGDIGFYVRLRPFEDGLRAVDVGNRKYRVSVWARTAAGTPPMGQLFVRAGANATLTSLSLVSSSVVTAAYPYKAGPWHLLHLVFAMPPSVLTAVQNGGVNLYIGCENPGTETVYFDDFRLQPVQAPMTAYVYDAHTHQRTHTLDNDNLYTRTEYDIAGQVKRVYREVLDAPGRPGGERIVSERETNFHRMNKPTWVSTGAYRIVQPPFGSSSSGLVQWEERNVNTRSQSFGSLRDNPVPAPCSWCQ